MVWPLILAGVGIGAYVGSQVDDGLDGFFNPGGNAPTSPVDSFSNAVNSISGLLIVGGLLYGGYYLLKGRG